MTMSRVGISGWGAAVAFGAGHVLFDKTLSAEVVGLLLLAVLALPALLALSAATRKEPAVQS
ncbi:hypothetical protein G3A43_08095 [Paraburkholderia aspalathi]|nr:hypothetical protein [Paraburkholderia aspalathi]MBK3780217.1 hypothetical protein [Paraburkholderia aspalathi]